MCNQNHFLWHVAVVEGGVQSTCKTCKRAEDSINVDARKFIETIIMDAIIPFVVKRKSFA